MSDAEAFIGRLNRYIEGVEKAMTVKEMRSWTKRLNAWNEMLAEAMASD